MAFHFALETMNHPGLLWRAEVNLPFNARTIRLNLLNFCDPFFNTTPDKRPEMEFALGHLVRRRLVEADGQGGWKLPSA